MHLPIYSLLWYAFQTVAPPPVVQAAAQDTPWVDSSRGASRTLLTSYRACLYRWVFYYLCRPHSTPILSSMFLPVSFFINCAGRTLLQSYRACFYRGVFLLTVPAALYSNPIEHVFNGEFFINCAGRTLLTSSCACLYQWVVFIYCAGRTLYSHPLEQVFTGEFFNTPPVALYSHPLEHFFTGEFFLLRRKTTKTDGFESIFYVVTF